MTVKAPARFSGAGRNPLHYCAWLCLQVCKATEWPGFWVESKHNNCIEFYKHLNTESQILTIPACVVWWWKRHIWYCPLLEHLGRKEYFAAALKEQASAACSISSPREVMCGQSRNLALSCSLPGRLYWEKFCLQVFKGTAISTTPCRVPGGFNAL